MTTATNIAIGDYLGFPPCCVRDWSENVNRIDRIAHVRGGVTLRVRDADEVAQVTAGVNKILADRGESFRWRTERHGGDPRVHFVPCAAHYRGGGLTGTWEESRWSMAWRCCDWCDHDRCTIDRTRCQARCIHVCCGVSAGVIDWPDV
jgi:hypothetical protein